MPAAKKKTPAKQAPAKKVTAKNAVAKKSVAKKAPAKKPVAKATPSNPPVTLKPSPQSNSAIPATPQHLGGFHSEANALRNLLAHRGLSHPATAKPLSEALIIGIGGGVQPGYSFCPSVGRHELGSGIYIVSRSSMINTGPSWPLLVLSALGCQADVHETGGIKGATTRIREDIEAKNWPLVWVNHVNMPYLGLDCSIGCQSFLHLVVAYAIDEAAGTVTVGDTAPEPVTISLADLNAARERVCSFKNRSLRITKSPATLTMPVLKRAVESGIRIYLDSAIKPRMKTFSIDGLEEWAKMINNSSNKKGWLSVFSGGQITRALRDVFLSIETDNSPGGLLRGVYADFLDEAGGILANPKLAQCAKTYRKLAAAWTRLAEDIFPDAWDATCSESKRLIRDRDRLFRERGVAATPEIMRASKRLNEIENSWLDRGTLVPQAKVEAHLSDMVPRIRAMVDAERAALAELTAAIA